MGYSVLATFVFGVDTVLFVAVSDEILGTGPEGYGYLLAGLGVGGILAAPLVTRPRAPGAGPDHPGRDGRLLPAHAGVARRSEPAVAFAAQVVRGAATLFVDVLAVTALQRTLPGDVLARVFGAFNTLMLLAILVGSLVTGWMISGAGVDATIWSRGGACSWSACSASPGCGRWTGPLRPGEPSSPRVSPCSRRATCSSRSPTAISPSSPARPRRSTSGLVRSSSTRAAGRLVLRDRGRPAVGRRPRRGRRAQTWRPATTSARSGSSSRSRGPPA